MIKDKISYLFELCMEVQRGKDGNIESRKSERTFPLDDSAKGPTVFFRFYGHTAELEIQIFDEGWSMDSEKYELFNFYLDEDIDSEQFLKCKTLLENLIKEQKEKEEES